MDLCSGDLCQVLKLTFLAILCSLLKSSLYFTAEHIQKNPCIRTYDVQVSRTRFLYIGNLLGNETVQVVRLALIFQGFQVFL